MKLNIINKLTSTDRKEEITLGDLIKKGNNKQRRKAFAIIRRIQKHESKKS